MVAAAADNPVRGESPATPAITVTRVGVVIGAGFLPDCEVTVRITRPGESVSDYVTYTSDRNGDLHAELPATALSGILEIAPPTTAPTRVASAAGSGVTPIHSNSLAANRSRYSDAYVRSGANDESGDVGEPLTVDDRRQRCCAASITIS